jgi:type I restriction enzyme, S subunit
VLEQIILQLAARGLLVPQDINDEPAIGLLARLQASNSSSAPRGGGKWANKAARMTNNEKRFELPITWAWARLDDLSISIVDCPHSTPRFAPGGVLCIDTNSFKGGALLPHKLRYVAEATYSERVARLVPKPGDLVFAREGTVGESLIIPSDTVCCLGQRVMLFRLSNHVLNEFVRMTISSSDFLARLLELHKGIGAKHVNVGDMRAAVVPLPPLAEQHRIVARVEELRRLCAQLCVRLTEARRTQTQLADALVAEAAA